MILTFPLLCSVISAATWDLEKLAAPPRVWPATEVSAEGVSGFYYKGIPYLGKETRVFAWYGEPDHREGETVPGVVLVHGGGGTAFAKWVRYWNDHGFAAVAMDLRGRTGVDTESDPRSKDRHPWAGPDQFGNPRESAEKIEDDWVYHSVANIILANSFIRSRPSVDPDRIGVVGISWGGFMTCIAVGVDHRFAFGIPIYGCGFVEDSPLWTTAFWERMGPAATRQWIDRFDPSNYIAGIECPTLWINGPSDRHFTLNIHRRSFNLCGGRPTLSVQRGMGHSHTHGWSAGEAYVFAAAVVNEGDPLTKITGHGLADGGMWAEYDESVTPVTAELVYTREVGDWQGIEWETAPATIGHDDRRVTADVPPEAEACYICLIDDRGWRVSTPYVRATPGTSSGK